MKKKGKKESKQPQIGARLIKSAENFKKYLIVTVLCLLIGTPCFIIAGALLTTNYITEHKYDAHAIGEIVEIKRKYDKDITLYSPVVHVVTERFTYEFSNDEWYDQEFLIGDKVEVRYNSDDLAQYTIESNNSMLVGIALAVPGVLLTLIGGFILLVKILPIVIAFGAMKKTLNNAEINLDSGLSTANFNGLTVGQMMQQPYVGYPPSTCQYPTGQSPIPSTQTGAYQDSNINRVQ